MMMIKQGNKGGMDDIGEGVEQQGEGAAFNAGVATAQRIHEILRGIGVCRANYYNPQVGGLNALVGRVFALHQELDCFMTASQRAELQPLMGELQKLLAKPSTAALPSQVHGVIWALELRLRRVAFEAGLSMPKRTDPKFAFAAGGR